MADMISLQYDFSFKHLFLNEDIRRYFISDALGIPLEGIRSVRLSNPYLWKRFRRQKQGILDVIIELNENRKVNVEMQVRMLSHWDKRSLFYLSKMYTEDLLVGQKYYKLKKCICIHILGFSLDDRPEYHKVYRLRDETGHEYSDLLEIRVIELNKPLSGTDPMDDWIRLFNAKTKEELDMLQANTKNPGVLEAIKEVRIMNLGKTMRTLYEGHMKQIRDQYARDEYVRAEGMEQGMEQGMKQGMAQGKEQGIKQGIEQGMEQLNRLNLRLIADGRLEDLERAAKDRAYLEKLLAEYGIR